jgi:hypothetical protein
MIEGGEVLGEAMQWQVIDAGSSDIFKKELVNQRKHVVKFTTQGEVIDQRFRKTK